ncbi:expressed unknown protein [Seminavis robusta]|uniref:Uncharacterized protein n=1 Tax=Seminavis robusta TaxID=568900 RepID=A0A9N8EYK1_9STRA|nr:expressed unknown protein [Seminavis robusta]|eukprot:Sro1987_g309540.1 n/a (213) ;mRNA; f:4846-5484
MTPFLEMEMEPLTQEMAAVSLKKPTKQVKFAPWVSQITFPANVDAAPMDMLWYDKGEMQKLAKKDLDLLISQEKSQNTGVNGQAGEEVVCSRGLEMYLRGQLPRRHARRRCYETAVLRKQAQLKALLGNATANAKEQVAERLQKFLIVKSKACQEEARALGVQDAIDAQQVYHSATKTPSEHVALSNSASHATKQALTSMQRHPQTTVLRAA